MLYMQKAFKYSQFKVKRHKDAPVCLILVSI